MRLVCSYTAGPGADGSRHGLHRAGAGCPRPPAPTGSRAPRGLRGPPVRP